MTTAQKMFIGLILLFTLFTLSIAIPTSPPEEAENTPAKLETTPVDIADLPFDFNSTVVPEDPTAEAWMKCETSMGSPWLSNARAAVSNLNNHRNNNCCQNNPWGSKCSRLAHYGNADIAICGVEYGCLKCGYVADLADALNNNCNNWDRVGGIHYVHEGARIIIY